VKFARALAAALFAVSAAAGAADPGKVLRTAFSIAESSFDPVMAWDAASNSVVEEISESMLEYEYLARPVKLAPLTLERLPEVSDKGATYVCHLRKGIYFTPDRAFNGKPRELVAADYAYSLKRLLDPAQKSPWSRASSSAGTNCRRRRRRVASSTLTRRSPGSRSWTATPCASG
jgi:ABC-type transport system substrate-binding protein